MKTLLWDFDGTLGFRQGGMWAAALLQTIRQEDPLTPVTMEQLRPFLQSGFPWQNPELPHPEIRTAEQWWQRVEPVFECAMLGNGFDSKQAERLAKRVRPVYTQPEVWRLFEDVIPTLQRCASLGWQHVLLTNHVPELGSILEHLGLDKFLAAVYNSAETGFEKPHPQAFQTALAGVASPQLVRMIGDSYTADIQGAACSGIPGILVRKYQPEAEIFCERLDEIPAFLGQSKTGPTTGRENR